ncbi:MAG: hypothetical protein ACSHYA_02420 [Opitutaceae bacterium]
MKQNNFSQTFWSAREIFFLCILFGVFSGSVATANSDLDNAFSQILSELSKAEPPETAMSFSSQKYVKMLSETLKSVDRSNSEQVSAINRHLKTIGEMIVSEIGSDILNSNVPFDESFGRYGTVVELSALSVRIYGAILPFSKYGSTRETLEKYLKYGEMDPSNASVLIAHLPEHFVVDQERFINRSNVELYLQIPYLVSLRIVKSIDNYTVDSSFFQKNIRASEKVASNLEVTPAVASYLFYTGDFGAAGSMSLLAILSIGKSLVHDDPRSIDGIQAYAAIGKNVNGFFDFLARELDNGLPELRRLCGWTSIIQGAALKFLAPRFRVIFLNSAHVTTFEGSLEIAENLTACLRSEFPPLQDAVASRADDLFGFAAKFSSFVLRYYNQGTWEIKGQDNEDTLRETIRLAAASIVAFQAAVEYLETSESPQKAESIKRISQVLADLTDVPKHIFQLLRNSEDESLKYLAIKELGSVAYAVNRLLILAYSGEVVSDLIPKIEILRERVVQTILYDLKNQNDPAVISTHVDLLNDFLSSLDKSSLTAIEAMLNIAINYNRRLRMSNIEGNKNLVFDRFSAETSSQIDRFSNAIPEAVSIAEAHHLIELIKVTCNAIENQNSKKQLLDASIRLEFALIDYFADSSSKPIELVENVLNFGAAEALNYQSRDKSVARVIQALNDIKSEPDSLDRLNALLRSVAIERNTSFYSASQIDRIESAFEATLLKLRLDWIHKLPTWVKVPVAFLGLTGAVALIMLIIWIVYPSAFFCFSKYREKRPQGAALLSELGLKIVGIFQLVGILSRSRRTVDSWIQLNRKRFQAKICDLSDDFGESCMSARGQEFPYVQIGNAALLTNWNESFESDGASGKYWLTGQGGGIGKTTIAKKLAERTLDLFATDPRRSASIVVFLNEKWSGDLNGTIADRLNDAAETSGFDPQVVETLLKRGRIVVVIDGLSEMDTTVPNTKSIRHLLVTSRTEPVDQSCFEVIQIEPFEDPTNLTEFVSYYLGKERAEEEVGNLVEQLLSAFGGSFHADKKDKYVLTPLIARLAIEQSFRNRKFSLTMPGVIFDYVKLLWREHSGGFLDDEQLLEAASLVALYLLDTNYSPSRVTEKQILVDFVREDRTHQDIRFFEPSEHLDISDAILTELISTGLLQLDTIGRKIRFRLDPVAEFLAAYRILVQHDRASKRMKDPAIQTCFEESRKRFKNDLFYWSTRDQDARDKRVAKETFRSIYHEVFLHLKNEENLA